MVYSYNYHLIKSANSVTYNNFASEITFEFKTDQLQYVDLLNSYLSIRLRIEQNATANLGQANITCLKPLPIVSGVPATTSNDFIPYLSESFLAGLFSTGKMSINDKVISTVNDIQSVQTLYKSAFDTKTIYETIESTNPIRPLTIEDTIQPIATYGTYGMTTNAQDFTKLCPYSGKSKYAWDSMGFFKYAVENTCNMSLPFPLFMSEQNTEGLPPDNRVKLSFMVDQYYPTNIVQFTQNATAAVGIANITNLTSAWSCPANSIGVGVADISLYLRVYTKANPLSDMRLHLKQIFSQIHTIQSNNESYNLSVPSRNITYILATFLQANRYGKGSSPSDFSDGVTRATPAANEILKTTGAVNKLQYIRFNYKGKQYPETDFNIQNYSWQPCPTAGANTISTNMELHRLLTDVVNNAQNRDDRCGSLYNLSSIAVEPIFVYRIADYPNSDDNNMLVSINLANGYTDSSSALLVVCLYDEFIDLKYSDGGKVIETVFKN